MSVIDKNEGREAILRAFPLIQSKLFSLLLVDLITGLTHQIRVQLASHGNPLVGDSKYGGSKIPEINSYFLHSCCLGFVQPIFEDMPLTIFDPLPNDFGLAISYLFNMNNSETDALISHRIDQSLAI